MLIALLGLVTGAHASGSCFNVQPASPNDAPFDDNAIARMSTYFLMNLNVNGSGAIVASPGAVPALPDSCPGGYRFHWMRDGALSIRSLMETTNVTKLSATAVAPIVEAYVEWVKSVTAGSAEPKWNITAKEPYAFGWCRPQTDGRPLRALSLLAAMRHHDTWALATADLDWLAEGGHFDTPSCDLWEEGTSEPNLLWNRVAMRSALLTGAAAAKAQGDVHRQTTYEKAASEHVVDPFTSEHLHAGSAYFIECPEQSTCAKSGKMLDGVVILALVHAGAAATKMSDPASAAVARTVSAFNVAFCDAYPINNKQLPGILYGRYTRDQYGGGNPWLLITAALANLLYRAAISAAHAPPAPDAVDAWRATFGVSFGRGAGGFPVAFVAAADSVLRRLRLHVVAADNDHLYEQIDKNTGAQYNAKDLTWSYAEMLSALEQRRLALAAVH